MDGFTLMTVGGLLLLFWWMGAAIRQARRTEVNMLHDSVLVYDFTSIDGELYFLDGHGELLYHIPLRPELFWTPMNPYPNPPSTRVFRTEALMEQHLEHVTVLEIVSIAVTTEGPCGPITKPGYNIYADDQLVTAMPEPTNSRGEPICNLDPLGSYWTDHAKYQFHRMHCRFEAELMLVANKHRLHVPTRDEWTGFNLLDLDGDL